MYDALDISASGLLAQRTRVDTIAANLANMNTTHDANNKPSPYRRRFAVFASGQPDNHAKPGVHVESIGVDQGEFRRVYEPGNADAGPDGYVKYPNIDMTTEMVNAMEASRAYEANVTSMEVSKAMITSELRLLA